MSLDQRNRLCLLVPHIGQFAHLRIFIHLPLRTRRMKPIRSKVPCVSIVAHVEFQPKIVTKRDEGVKHAMVTNHPRRYRCSECEGRSQSGCEPALSFLKPPE